MSKAHDAELEIEGLGGELMPFQRAGVAYALERRRVFLADEQGLGKTIQALATVQADLAYPAVVICPASLKLNWLREIETWLPGRKAQVLSGRTTQDLGGADLVVLNYEIAAAHLDGLRGIAPRALILDESHYVKNPLAVRTKAVLELVEGLGPDALRLALTGTPVVNRPAELAPQLRALDRLGEYGTMSSFRRGYATPGSRRKLHSRLRSSCFLRRRKADVLSQLPAKRRAVVPVPTTNGAEYRRAEQNFIRWLSEQADADGSGRMAPAARAEALVKMTALRRLAARGKLDAALSWIEDFSESGERLVVFAHHREIQAAVIERFDGCARVVGDDAMDEREANVRRFQSDDGPAICVCSLQVAAHGFTLTAAANVVFLELDWTPAKHDQAEDRLHRIGQAESVTAWYLLATETIDERIAALLAEKRDVVDSVTDGGGGDGASIADELIGSYVGR
jgi:SNF2 family DNA or RNA helicase